MKPRMLRIRHFGSSLLITAACFALLVGSWGYSRARVTNQVQLRVASSEDALIAVKVDTPTAVQGETVACGSVTNQLPFTIYMGAEGLGLSTYQLLPGETAALTKAVSSAERLGDNLYEGLIHAKWDRGSADIRVHLSITVLSRAPTASSLTWDEHQQIGRFDNTLTVPVTLTISAPFVVEKDVVEPGDSTSFWKAGPGERVELQIHLPNGQEFLLAGAAP